MRASATPSSSQHLRERREDLAVDTDNRVAHARGEAPQRVGVPRREEAGPGDGRLVREAPRRRVRDAAEVVRLQVVQRV